MSRHAHSPLSERNQVSAVVDSRSRTQSVSSAGAQLQPVVDEPNTRRPDISRRATGRLSIFRSAPSSLRVPKLTRNKYHRNDARRPDEGPHSIFARISSHAQQNLRIFYSRGLRRKTETERLQDLEKSRLLFNELFTVTPMVMVFASTIQTNIDELEHQRVPVLLEQISIRVTRETAPHYSHLFRIRLEYASGPSMIKWTILRGYRDFLWLKARLNGDNILHRNSIKPPKLPKLKHFRSEPNDVESESTELAIGENDIEPTMTTVSDSSNEGETKESVFPTLETAIEDYLNKLLHCYRFRQEDNKLLAFLELSHMSIKLAPEYPLHGREGKLVIRSRASEMGWRVKHYHPKDWRSMIKRHTPKWVLVRDSFILVVDDIVDTRIREVFFVDSYFEVAHITEAHNVTDLRDDTPVSVTAPEIHEGVLVDQGDASIANDSRASPQPDVRNVKVTRQAKSFFLHLRNNARDIKLTALGERDLRRWQSSILQMKQRTVWSKKHRFDSFAPVRKNVYSQWFVEARDYFWTLSDALENARDTIYILDWWLSPELYLRRPPEGNQRWRLDRILKRKAEQGVKIFVVIYRNVGPTIPIDSLWTKHSLLDLHENIYVLRSPNQLFQKAALFWAHHEKLCIVDTTIAFCGGIDLCFGRWDTPQHVLIDDKEKAFYESNDDISRDGDDVQYWPGKDYSNPRVHDFYNLDHPYEDMYDRNKVPRMPWHDVHQMVVGQPARDLARHFVQRWNYVLRQKLPSRKTPLLLPPPDYTQVELERLGLTGTCEYQVLRSSGDWSLGLRHHEQSIQNAYLKLIEESEHFVYIENQFFITSTEVDGVVIENQIGDALVDRIRRAHYNGEQWRAYILIPLTPGFEAQVDSADAYSVRAISKCQFKSISRGQNSIFYRLEREGIKPNRYIGFYSLRKWGKFKEKGTKLTTEQLYIHGKTMIVDDRVAVIGSANINERSMRGIRDSEIAVCIRDTKIVASRMAGKPWKAAHYAYSLRVRLMREHLGVDVDKVDIIESWCRNVEYTANMNAIFTDPSTVYPSGSITPGKATPSLNLDTFPEWLYPELHSFNWYAGTDVNKGLHDHKKLSTDFRVQNNAEHKADVEGNGLDHMNERENLQDQKHNGVFTTQNVPVETDEQKRAERIAFELLKDKTIEDSYEFKREFYIRYTGIDLKKPVPKYTNLSFPTTDEEGKKVHNNFTIPIDPWIFDDPLDDSFFYDRWLAVAERNTYVFRMVFRCQPDDEVHTWRDYKLYVSLNERFNMNQCPAENSEDGCRTNQLEKKLSAAQKIDGEFAYMSPSDLHQQVDELNVGQLAIMPEDNQASSEKLSDTGMKQDKDLTNTPDTKSETIDDESPSLKLQNNQELPSRQRVIRWRTPAETQSVSENSLDGSSVKLTQANDEPTLETNQEHGSKARISAENADANAANTDMGRMHAPAGSMPGCSKNLPGPEHDNNVVRKYLKTPLSYNGLWRHPDSVLDAEVAENLLAAITGHLVIFPTEWLNREIDSDNWHFEVDKMAPLEIWS